jgi:hypothetical protein
LGTLAKDDFRKNTSHPQLFCCASLASLPFLGRQSCLTSRQRLVRKQIINKREQRFCTVRSAVIHSGLRQR